VAEISLARELVACPRHDQEGYPRCDGSGYRPLKRCTGCGEPAGSISEGTGAPLVRSREDGEHYHVNCLPILAVVTSVTVETVGM
jgi:hypothetical protein